MPSFDIVSEVDLQEARNAVDNASREVESRFDFRGVEATFELNDANKTIKVLSESDFQVNQLLDILRAKLLKRGIEGTSLDVPEDIVHSGKTWFVEAKLKQGIESAVQKKIVKLIKDSKLKVQAQIQGEEIRVTGKSRDDLQSVMALVRETYQRLFNSTPNIQVIHAGLECGLFKKPYPDMDMVSIGPTITGPHSPDEQVHIESVGQYWTLLTELLKAIPAK